MMRFLTALISMLLVSLLCFPVMTLAAEKPIQLVMNGKKLSSEVSPRIVKGNTLVPVRVIAESLGSKVQWEEKSRKVTVVKSDVTIQLFIDKTEAWVNNRKTSLEAAPLIESGNTMLPVRFVSEQFGIKVTWDELTRSVFLYKDEVRDEDKELEELTAVDKPEETKPALPDSEEAVTEDNTDVTNEDKGSNTDDSQNVPDVKQGTSKPAAEANDPPSEVASIKDIQLQGDVLTVVTSGLKPPAAKVLKGTSNQIILEIRNSKLNPALKLNSKGEGSVKELSPLVTQIRYLLFSKESSIVRILVDSSKKLELTPISVKTAAGSSTLAWKIALQQSKPQGKFKVVIDPGHGGKDSGAISVLKRNEKDFVLSLGTKVYKLLEKEPDIDPHMTRSTDEFIELSDRTKIANDLKADLFVSIHANSAGKESITGTETYYYTEQSLEFAKLMHELLIDATGFTDRKVKQNDFYVVKHTTMPSLLLEVGFLTNTSDEKAMYSEDFQNKVAAAIVAGIKKQLKID